VTDGTDVVESGKRGIEIPIAKAYWAVPMIHPSLSL
jgi:hypothetical protein